ncbi:MAG: YHS domain-containing protein [FCB group bacterium]|nr:YHS domain-containing protein [FCB group bacterium]
MNRCITCQKPVNRNKAHMIIELKGKLYLACCPMCQSEFEKNPEKYIRRIEDKHSKR